MYNTVIADDEKLICDYVLSVLNAATPELKSVNVFHNGADAYDYVNTHQADICILDIEMPEKSGLDVAQLLSTQKHNKYVILITAYQDFSYAKRAIDCNVDAFLTKPISSEQLVDTVRKGIVHLESNNWKKSGRFSAQRSLLQAYCSLKVNGIPKDFYLCNGTAILENLLCTQILLQGLSIADLSPDALNLVEKALFRSVEKETAEQTSFLLETSAYVKILVFSKAAPDLAFLEDVMQILSYHTNSKQHPDMSTYPSFADFLSYLEFRRELETYFSLTADGNLKSAQSKLRQYLQTLSTDQICRFTNYLSKHYQVIAETPNVDGIMNALANLLSTASTSMPINHIVISACEYIQSNFHSPQLSLESTADALSISSAHLSRLFKKHTGHTYSDHLLQIRMEHAKHLLDTTNLPTPEIAVATGYEKSAYFRTAFKAHFGLTPLQYRQMTCGRNDNNL